MDQRAAATGRSCKCIENGISENLELVSEPKCLKLDCNINLFIYFLHSSYKDIVKAEGTMEATEHQSISFQRDTTAR